MDYLIIDEIKNKKGQNITQIKETHDTLIIKQYTGINSDNFVIKKANGNVLNFSFFKLNGIFYININNEHILDYKKFTKIQLISCIEEGFTESVKINNLFFGEIIIKNCDTEIFMKALDIMNKYYSNKTSLLSEIIYFLVN